MKFNPLPLLIATSALMFITAVMAQTPLTPAPGPGGMPGGDETPCPMQDSHGSGQGMSAKTFIKEASQYGLIEVQLATLAQRRSQSEDVRAFAAQMREEHNKANSELQSIAAAKHVAVAAALDPDQEAMITELSGKSGADFDAAYSGHMVTAHDKAVALFKSASESQDKDISAFAAKALPTVEHYKGMAEDLASKRRLAAAGAAGSTT